MIELAGVGHVWSDRTPWAKRALADVDLAVSPGEGLLVVGANGSGKSTLAWIAAGLLVPSEGTATLDGTPLHQADGVGISFQHARLQLFRPTVAEDILFGSGDVGPDDVEPALARVGLDPSLGGRRVDELSGGQQRRVVIAGLLARRPSLLVLDEPFAGLDMPGRDTLVEVLRRLRNNGLALVVVSHDYEGASLFADRVVALSGGRIVMEADAGGTLAALDEVLEATP